VKTDRDIKNYIDDNIRKSTDSSIQALSNHLGIMSRDITDIKVAVQHIQDTGENTLRQATKTNGRVDRAEIDIEFGQRETNTAKINLAVIAEQQRMIKMIAMFMFVVVIVQMTSFLSGIPTDQLFKVIVNFIS